MQYLTFVEIFIDIVRYRSKEQQDFNVTEEDIDKCSLDVEREMFSFFGDTGQRYKNKYRSLMFNLKDPRNKVRLVGSFWKAANSHCLQFVKFPLKLMLFQEMLAWYVLEMISNV